MLFLAGLLTPPDATRLTHPGYSVVADSTAAAALSGSSSLRLPDALRATFPDRFLSSSAAKRAVRRRLVILDDGECGTCTDSVIPGTTRLRIMARVEPGPAPGEGRRSKCDDPLACVFEDDHMAVVYKPAGLAVQGAVRSRLALGLQPTRLRGETPGCEPLWRPQHVHRLDAPTSGLLVCAKTGQALRTLSAAFASRSVHKRYRAILAGRLATESGTTLASLSGQAAQTDWRVVSFHETPSSPLHRSVTLVDFFPLTGRTHQLRRHAALLGHPIIGDRKYWNGWDGGWQHEEQRASDATDAADAEEEVGAMEAVEAEWDRHDIGLMLSAIAIELPHPWTGEPLAVRTEQPASFDSFLRRSSS